MPYRKLASLVGRTKASQPLRLSWGRTLPSVSLWTLNNSSLQAGSHSVALHVHLQGYKVGVHTGAVTGQEQLIAASLRGERENLWLHPLESSTCPPIVRGLPGRFHALPNKSEEKLGSLQEHGFSPKSVTIAWLCTHCRLQISYM